MENTNEKYLEILRKSLQSQKVWERNDVMDSFRKQLKESVS